MTSTAHVQGCWEWQWWSKEAPQGSTTYTTSPPCPPIHTVLHGLSVYYTHNGHAQCLRLWLITCHMLCLMKSVHCHCVLNAGHGWMGKLESKWRVQYQGSLNLMGRYSFDPRAQFWLSMFVHWTLREEQMLFSNLHYRFLGCMGIVSLNIIKSLNLHNVM